MTDSEIVVFLGPSLPLKVAESILKVRYFPPARQGDILSLALQLRPKAIGLIDGYFAQSLSVWHKEILYAMDQGIAVFGASSMGALRAAEMESCGMVGIGKIFELYREGIFENDDEVALLHGPPEEGYPSFSIPLVNLRFTLYKAELEGKISPDLCQEIISIAQSLYYPHRTLENIAKEGRKKGIEVPIQILENGFVDQKGEDAKLLLEAIKTPSLPQAQGDFQSPCFNIFYHLDRRRIVPGASLSQRSVALHAALHHPRFSEIRFAALNQVLADLLANLLNIEVTQDEVEKERTRMQLRRQISDEAEWRLRNDLSKEDFEELLRRRAVSRKLHHAITVCHTPWQEVKYVLEELKWSGEYEAWFDKALCQEDVLHEISGSDSETDLPALPIQQLVENHLQETPWNPDLPYEEWWVEAGFLSLSELKSEMVKAQIARAHLKSWFQERPE